MEQINLLTTYPAFRVASPIPTTVRTWREQLQKHSLNRPEIQLWRIKDRLLRPNMLRHPNTALSGSTMREDDFLFLRAIWPEFGRETNPDADYPIELLKEVGLIDNLSLNISRGKLGLDNNLGPGSRSARSLDTQKPAIADHEKPPATPRTPESYQPRHPDAPGKERRPAHAGEDDGTLSSNMVSWFHNFVALSDYRYPNRVAEAEHLGAFFTAYDTFASISGLQPEREVMYRLDLESPLSRLQTPETGSPVSLSDLASLALGDDSPTGKSRGWRDYHYPGANEGTPPVDKIEAPSLDETYITVFATSFFAALSSLVHRSGSHHRMEPVRAQFQCGSWDADSTSRPYFNAAVDAVVKTKVSAHSRSSQEKLMDCLLLSEFKRDSYDDLKGTVEIQETAEVAAFLATYHAAVSSSRNSDREGASLGKKEKHCIVMLSQYRLDISIILAQYEPEWLDYIRSGHQPVSSEELSEKHMLRMRRIGLYWAKEPSHMYRLAHILAALVIKDSRDAAAAASASKRQTGSLD